MSEPRSEQVDDDVASAGATDEARPGSGGANLSIEDDPRGTTDPADLAGTADREDDAS